ncbi:hypothetical protein Bpfe_011080 [Biomphalaria pfeifferi]|uniref:Uncharacterized protein n=1 Tax=Biomphalaria pfeifferi TaxID=112525 RepID=A0AAD8BTQ3_BIOPF|nr:hypothetical protein Bpfe_011080 [Biomphalaria pfeifferi]
MSRRIPTKPAFPNILSALARIDECRYLTDAANIAGRKLIGEGHSLYSSSPELLEEAMFETVYSGRDFPRADGASGEERIYQPDKEQNISTFV